MKLTPGVHKDVKVWSDTGNNTGVIETVTITVSTFSNTKYEQILINGEDQGDFDYHEEFDCYVCQSDNGDTWWASFHVLDDQLSKFKCGHNVVYEVFAKIVSNPQYEDGVNWGSILLLQYPHMTLYSRLVKGMTAAEAALDLYETIWGKAEQQAETMMAAINNTFAQFATEPELDPEKVSEADETQRPHA